MRNLTNTGGDIFVNTMFGGGEATEIVQQSFNTQALVNVAMKANTTQATSLNDTDILIIADGATGKVIQYITVADFKTAGTLWSLSGNQLYPDNQNYNVVIGTSNGANANNYGILVLDKTIAIQTSAGSQSSQGLRIINDTFSTNTYVDNAGDMYFAGATNDYNFDKQVVINTTGAELSNGTNTYTLPSSNGTLALTSDIGSGEWTLSSGNLYPNATATNVIIGNTLNLSNRKLYISGDAELTGNLYFNNGDIYIDSNSQNLRNYAGYTAGNIGGQHLFYVKQSNNAHEEVGSISTRGISSVGNSNVNSGKNVISLLTGGGQYFKIENAGTSGGSPYVDFQGEQDGAGGTSDYYFKWSIGTSGSLTEYMRLSTTGLTGSNLFWKAQPIQEIYGGTNQSSYATGDILYASASNTLSKLTIGSNGKVLKVVGGVPAWATDLNTDLTTATGFGTAATSDVSVGNSAGTAASVGLKLYGDEFLLHNTSNVNVATFTPVSNTCNLSLNGGVLSLATMGSNTTWNGNAIAYNYGGTGLSSLTANKILQVNQNANGYNLVDMPSATTQYWSLSSNVLAPVNSGYAIRGENGIRVGTAGEFVDIGYNTSTNVFSIDHQSGNLIFEYDDDNGYITFGTIGGARMDFNNYVLHGADTAYPTGVNMPFGTIGSIYVSSAYIRSITTDDVSISEYQGNPATASSNIRCKKVGSNNHLYTTGERLELSYLYGQNSTQNYIEHFSSYGFTLFGTIYSGRSYNLSFKNTGSGSNYGFIGCENEGLFLHLNGYGDAMAMYSENSKACMKINNALRINGFISTAGNSLSGNQTDGTIISTNYFKPYSNNYWQEFAGNSSGSPFWDLWGSDYDPGNINSTGVGLVCERGVFLKSGALFLACDRRNKHNITPIDDKFALNVINNCNMYKFKHNDQIINTGNWYYNVMAQEVQKVFPEGVNVIRDYLADIMTGVKCSFEKIEENKYKMKVLNPKEEWKLNKGEKFKFLMNNDFNNGWNIIDDEHGKCDIKYLKCEEDNTFIVDKEYKHILLYGRKVNDYLIVDKEKLYSLQHSAIQELSKINDKQQEEINTLKEEVNGLKEMLNKLVNSKSFAEFKKTIA